MDSGKFISSRPDCTENGERSFKFQVADDRHATWNLKLELPISNSGSLFSLVKFGNCGIQKFHKVVDI
jgi:hypothetical protein